MTDSFFETYKVFVQLHFINGRKTVNNAVEIMVSPVLYLI